MDWIIGLLIVFVCVLLVAGIFATGIGILTLIHLVRNKPLPMDESNRINHVRLWWFVLTRPELFVNNFPWLKQDEFDNMK